MQSKYQTSIITFQIVWASYPVSNQESSYFEWIPTDNLGIKGYIPASLDRDPGSIMHTSWAFFLVVVAKGGFAHF